MKTIQEKYPVTDMKIDSNGIIGKLVCGYQGWFAAEGDGTANAWIHWARRSQPRKNNQTFEIYPDMSEYDRADVFKTAYEPFAGGTVPSLFSSSRITVTDLHFKWMNQYGIDGAALQRFMVATPESRSAHINKVLENVIICAEKYGRIFYMCYDFSGFKSDNFAADFFNDFEKTVVDKYGTIKSPAYLKVNGKPVVQLWGIGFSDRNNDPDDFARIISRLKDNGYYVIGGVPTHWRLGKNDAMDNFSDVFAMLDMVSPWLVGRFRDPNGITVQYQNNAVPDMELCASRGQDYMPVIFPGFAWSNWHGGNMNSIPRAAGEFMWKQAVEAAALEPAALYVAMFDEYDEATAIMKMAADSAVIPSDQYFLTGSADNVYVSPDFYLRLTGEITKLFKGERGTSVKVDIPYSEGPVYLRTSFEPNLDVCTEPAANGVNCGFSGTVARIDDRSVPVKSGNASVQIKGHIEKNGILSYKILDLDFIAVQPDMKLEYNYFIASGNNISLILTADSGAKISRMLTDTDMAAGKWMNDIIDIQDWVGLKLNGISIECSGPGDIEVYFDDFSVYV